MSKPLTRLFVENRGEVLIATALFDEFAADERLSIKMCWDPGSAISIAESSLLTNPSTAVAVLLNCGDRPETFRLPFERILQRSGPRSQWHVALAIPDMTSWVLRDSVFAAAVSQAAAAGRPVAKVDLAVFAKEWVASGNQFGLDGIRTADAEFARLYEFVLNHTTTAASAN